MASGPSSSTIKRRGLLLVLSSPSGAGKSTIARFILENDEAFTLSVSVTTRTRRGSEIDGVHYHFLSDVEFTRLRDTDALLEWAEVHGNHYGTPREAVEKAMADGRDMVFDIDWQGALQLQQKMPEDVVSVFILPPSLSALASRLKRRAEDSAEVIAMRLDNSRAEMEHWRDYDYVVVNHDLQSAYAAVKSIVEAERLRRDRQTGLPQFVTGLRDEKLDP